MLEKDFDSRYEEYRKEAAGIMASERTATMTRKNEAPEADPKTWAKSTPDEAEAFWERGGVAVLPLYHKHIGVGYEKAVDDGCCFG